MQLAWPKLKYNEAACKQGLHQKDCIKQCVLGSLDNQHSDNSIHIIVVTHACSHPTMLVDTGVCVWMEGGYNTFQMYILIMHKCNDYMYI